MNLEISPKYTTLMLPLVEDNYFKQDNDIMENPMDLKKTQNLVGALFLASMMILFFKSFYCLK